MTTTADDGWQLLAELTASEKEQGLRDTERLLEEQFQETDRQIREVGKQIDNLGGKWGQFVEKMVAPERWSRLLVKHCF
jgi:hypothetical protein